MADSKAHNIAYCGLYCKGCPILAGEISDLAGQLEKKLDEAEFARVAKGLAEFSRLIPSCAAFAHYEDFHKLLGVMKSEMRCTKYCKAGGGSGKCQIRKCCKKKELDGCWQCSDFETCEKLTVLEYVHEKRHINNLIILRDKGVASFLKGPKKW
jgi:hypothetical protein